MCECNCENVRDTRLKMANRRGVDVGTNLDIGNVPLNCLESNRPNKENNNRSPLYGGRLYIPYKRNVGRGDPRDQKMIRVKKCQELFKDYGGNVYSIQCNNQARSDISMDDFNNKWNKSAVDSRMKYSLKGGDKFRYDPAFNSVVGCTDANGNSMSCYDKYGADLYNKAILVFNAN